MRVDPAKIYETRKQELEWVIAVRTCFVGGAIGLDGEELSAHDNWRQEWCDWLAIRLLNSTDRWAEIAGVQSEMGKKIKRSEWREWWIANRSPALCASIAMKDPVKWMADSVRLLERQRSSIEKQKSATNRRADRRPMNQILHGI